MVAISVLRLKVWMDGVIAFHIGRAFIYPAAHEFFRDFFAKFLHHSKILCIRSAGCQCFGEGMLTDEGTACHSFEPIFFQNISQFDEGIVKITITEGNHRHRQRAIAFYLFIQIRQQHIRYTTGNHRCTANHNVTFAKNCFFFTHTGQCPIIYFQRQTQLCCQCFCCCFYCFFCTPSWAEIHRPYFFHLHIRSSFFSCMTKELPFFSSYPILQHFST